MMPQPDPFAPGLAVADAPRPAPGDRLMARKAELEAAMEAAPHDATLRAGYFEHLTRIAGVRSGLCWAMLPEIGAPLWFRGGTADVAALASVFRDDVYAPPGLRATAQRILVIGAYAGYAAVALAHRHRRASLLCAEPLPDNIRVLALNTTPFRRIRVAQTALWHSPTRLAAAGRLQSDWAVRLTDEALDADRVIGAITVPELLARAGWSHADMVVCDAAGSEREIFIDPLAAWLRQVDVALVRCYDNFATQATQLVAASFPEQDFAHRKHGAMDLFERRTPFTSIAAQPEEIHLIRPDAGGAPFVLHDVAPFGWAFFAFDGSSCQLHPNMPGTAPARAVFPIRLDGQTRFTSGLLHAGTPGAPGIVFRARLSRPDGALIAEGEATVAAHAGDRLSFALPEGTQGPALAQLETAMAPEAPHNQMGWARWIDPRLS